MEHSLLGNSNPNNGKLANDNLDAVSFRTPDVVMQSERLGAMHQTRISFVRTLLRKIDKENWTLTKHLWGCKQLNKTYTNLPIYYYNR
ncbi:hypothetical protein ACT3TI_04130 [Psychrobacter sp. AOP22-C1-22]|uniref:hypothetical protein n=1 Tax=unclassified Psychrobacter TaxID=196806 RepID=UPI0017884216|nr:MULTISPECIES: hypothetical protein [unclassified Psychrobacter]MBE0406047.1 hypothetical protein [Psychrobacter sp. FME6]MBE0444566.1 hypothetical protein [Psychrobacter sp. FME5]MDN5891830.1 hypothetical protein [Psychrobacter sp.]